MLLNNYKQLVRMTGSQSASYTTLSGSSTGINSNDYAHGIFCATGWNYVLGGRGNVALDVGFDDTPETAADYAWNGNLKNPQLSYLSGGVLNKSLGDIISLYAIFKNNSGSNVVVREIGMLGNCGGGTTESYFGLWIRKVLETPVTIAPGESYSFQYTLRFKNT